MEQPVEVAYLLSSRTQMPLRRHRDRLATGQHWIGPRAITCWRADARRYFDLKNLLGLSDLPCPSPLTDISWELARFRNLIEAVGVAS